MRTVVCLAVFVLVGCGRLIPGAIVRPETSDSVAPSGTGSGAPSGGGYKSAYDDKGCAVAYGESGQRQQAACRSGK